MIGIPLFYVRGRYYNIYFVVYKIEKVHYLCLYTIFYLLMGFECEYAINICFSFILFAY